jgi:hypothetical protein
MIVGREAVDKLESLPERHKGVYVSEAIIDKTRKEQEAMNASMRYIIPDVDAYSKESFEEYLRRIIREEISKALKDGSAD